MSSGSSGRLSDRKPISARKRRDNRTVQKVDLACLSNDAAVCAAPLDFDRERALMPVPFDNVLSSPFTRFRQVGDLQ